MGVFDYRHFAGEAGKALYADAIALTLYAYTPTGQALSPSGWTPVSASQLGYQGKVGPDNLCGSGIVFA